MILEILALLIRGVFEVIMSTAKGVEIGARYFMDALRVFREGAASANPLETLAILTILAAGGYLLYKFFWDSAKELVILVVALFVLFIISAFVV